VVVAVPDPQAHLAGDGGPPAAGQPDAVGGLRGGQAVLTWDLPWRIKAVFDPSPEPPEGKQQSSGRR